MFNVKVIGVVRTMRDNVEGKKYCDEFSEMTNDVINKKDFVFTDTTG